MSLRLPQGPGTLIFKKVQQVPHPLGPEILILKNLKKSQKMLKNGKKMVKK